MRIIFYIFVLVFWNNTLVNNTLLDEEDVDKVLEYLDVNKDFFKKP